MDLLPCSLFLLVYIHRIRQILLPLIGLMAIYRGIRPSSQIRYRIITIVIYLGAFASVEIVEAEICQHSFIHSIAACARFSVFEVVFLIILNKIFYGDVFISLISSICDQLGAGDSGSLVVIRLNHSRIVCAGAH